MRTTVFVISYECIMYDTGSSNVFYLVGINYVNQLVNMSDNLNSH